MSLYVYHGPPQAQANLSLYIDLEPLQKVVVAASMSGDFEKGSLGDRCLLRGSNQRLYLVEY